MRAEAACPVGQFDCTGTGMGNGTSCISAAHVCDNTVNCPGGLDENTAMICGKMSRLYMTLYALGRVVKSFRLASNGTVIACASLDQATKSLAGVHLGQSL